MADIDWANDISGSFTNASYWSGGAVPGSADSAYLDPTGTNAFTVTSSSNETVSGLNLDALATLSVANGTFAVRNGVVNAGTISSSYYSTVLISGTVENSGTIEVISKPILFGFEGGFSIGDPGVSLTGFGEVALSGVIRPESSTASITNVNNTIVGSGAIYANLINDPLGIVDASDSKIDVSNAINLGLLEATNGGDLMIGKGPVYGTINNTGGEIYSGHDSTISINVQTNIINGIVKSSGTAGIVGTYAWLSGIGDAIHLYGGFRFGRTTFYGTIDNAGTFTAAPTNVDNEIFLVQQGGATLYGGGQIILPAIGTDSLCATFESGRPILTNVDNTISGAGYVGDFQSDVNRFSSMTLYNEANGVVDANVATAPIVFFDNSGGLVPGTVINDGLIEATALGGITIDGVKFYGSGTILATNGAAVRLENAYIYGGQLVGKGASVFETVDTLSLLDGATSVVTNHATLEVLAGTALTLAGAINNVGSITLADSGIADLSVAAAGATLSGRGDIVLGDSGQSVLSGVSISATLTNETDTISGAGALGDGSMVLINLASGVIDADQSLALTLDTGTGQDINAGAIEAIGSGGLIISASTLDNVGGVISAATGSAITLEGADIEGGTISAEGGAIEVVSGKTKSGRPSTSTLDGSVSPLTLTGSIEISDGSSLTLEGSIVDQGEIEVAAQNNATSLLCGAGGATISGNGQILLADERRSNVAASAAGAILTLADDTLSGAGTVGDGNLGLINQAAGAIEATGTSALIVDTGLNTFVNAGQVEATGAGGLVLRSSTINNNGGTISALTSSRVTLQGVEIDGGNLVTNGAGLTRAFGPDNVFNSGALTVSAGGIFVVVANAGFTEQGTIENAGKLIAKGSAILTGSIANSGILETVGGSLTINGSVTGSGEAVIDGGAMTFGAGVSEKVVFDGDGTLVLADSQGYAGTVWRFSTTGADSLDLEDIAFGADTEVTYSGGVSGGVLTVTDGTQTAEIAMKGNYLSSTFTVASDGQGGTIVTDSIAAVPALAQAMAGFASASAAASTAHGPSAPSVRAATMIAPPSLR